MIARQGRVVSKCAAALILAVVAGASGAVPAAGAENATRPNIVIVLVDTLRADRLPFYGHRKNTAPFLSELARDSVVFDRALSTSSKTAPAVASMFSSLYPDQHGIVLGRMMPVRLLEQGLAELDLHRIPEGVETLAEILKRAGYSTWGISDNFNVCEDMGFAQGFDRFVSERVFDRGSAYVNGVLKGWHRKITKSEPYFLYVHYLDPHSPYVKQDRWYSVDPEDIKETHYNGVPLSREIAEKRAEVVSRYDSEIGPVDQRIREAYEMFGWDRNTLLVFVSDHGEEFWDHLGMRHGKTLFDEVVHVPLFFHGEPGLVHPSRVATPVSLVDILPTLAELVGMPVDGPHEGRSLVPELESGGRPDDPPRVLFAQVEGYPVETFMARNERRQHLSHFVVRAAMQGNWKLVRDTRHATAMLFDTAADPGEVTDLRTARADVAVELLSKLREFLARPRPFEPETFVDPVTEEDIHKLKTLGYVE